MTGEGAYGDPGDASPSVSGLCTSRDNSNGDATNSYINRNRDDKNYNYLLVLSCALLFSSPFLEYAIQTLVYQMRWQASDYFTDPLLSLSLALLTVRLLCVLDSHVEHREHCERDVCLLCSVC